MLYTVYLILVLETSVSVAFLIFLLSIKLCCAVFFALTNITAGKFLNIIHISVDNGLVH